MAATGTTRPSHRTARNGLPLTPRTTSSRRGGHDVIAPSTASVTATPESGVTSATHITPNAGIIARGDIRSASRVRTHSRTPQMAGIDLRRFRA